jgi:hypothetical protein
MSSQTNPLLGAGNARAVASSDPRTSSKRPYRAPELREVGAVADLTQSGPNNVPGDAAPYGS